PALRALGHDLALPALRAADPQRHVAGIGAVGVAGAGDEAAEAAMPLHQVGAALGARLADRLRQLGIVDRPRVLALRPAGAGQERPAPAELLHQLAAAVRAVDLGRLLDVLLELGDALHGALEILAEWLPQAAHHVMPLLAA